MSEEQEERTDLVAFGGGLKSLDDGKVGGYLVRFSSEYDPDLEGDYFDATTDYGIEPGAKTTVYFNHRQPVRTKAGKSVAVKGPIGKGTLTPDEHGIFIEAIIDEREQYEEVLSKLGWSSGTASYLVDREQVGKAWHIKRWPLGLDASITPTPAEPRNVTLALKALAHDADLEAEAQTGVTETPVAEATEGDEGEADMKSTITTTEVNPMTEEVKVKEQPQLDTSALTESIVNSLTPALAESMTKAMQVYMDKQAPAAKGVYTVDDALEELEGTKSFGDWLLSVKRRDDKRLREVYSTRKDLVEGDGTSGGYLVPEDFLNDMVRVADPFQEVVYPRARKIPTNRRSLRIPVLDQYDAPAAAYKIDYYGGVLSHWTEEAGTKTETEPAFKQLELVLHKLAGYTQASDELVADSVLSIDSLLRQLFGGVIRWRRDYAYLRGTGIGQPLGILNSGALLTTARDVANQISANDIHSLLQIFLPTSLGQAVFVASQTTMEQIFALSDGTNYIWNADATQRPTMTLYGVPVVWTEKLPALGTQGDILLADMSYYYILDRGGLAIDASEHYAFTSDLTTWRFVYRTDGQPSLSDPIYIDTTNQVSPFCVLAATTD